MRFQGMREASLRVSIIHLMAAAALFAQAALAAAPVLTIHAAVERALSREELAALPQHAITQTTEFTDGDVTFTGPLARDVIDAPQGATVAVMTAINDYSVEIPVEDFDRYDVILALEMNGKALTRRDKGPIWVMYPLAATDPAQKSLIDNRLIWQLRDISFR